MSEADTIQTRDLHVTLLITESGDILGTEIKGGQLSGLNARAAAALINLPNYSPNEVVDDG